MIVVIAIAISVAILQTSTARQRTLQVNELRIPAAFASQRLYAATLGSANALRGFMITRDAKMRQDWAEQWREIDRQSATLDALQRRFTDPGVRQSWAEAHRLLPRLRAAQTLAMELSATEQPEAAIRVLRTQVLPLFEQVCAVLRPANGADGMAPIQADLMVRDLSNASASVQRANILLLVGGALMLLTGAVAGQVTTRAITVPLGQLTGVLRLIAHDRWDVAIPGTGRVDEIGDIAKAAVVFRQNGLEHERQSRETERIRAELDRIYEHAPIGLALLDQKLRFIRVNSALAEMDGAPVEAHLGSTIGDIAPDLASKLTEMLLEVLRNGVALLDQVITGETAASAQETRTWSLNITPLSQPDCDERLVLVSMLDITLRKRAEARARLVMNELNHRIKNVFATVQSLSTQTLRTSTSLTDFKQAFEARLIALSETNDLLAAENWEGAWLRVLLNKEVEPYAAGGRIQVAGDSVWLNARGALGLGLIAHELATNAAKYGALTTPDGRIALRWDVSEGELRLTWKESGGPTVQPPSAAGFGSRLIVGSVKDLGGRSAFDYAPEGLSCTLCIPLEAFSD